MANDEISEQGGLLEPMNKCSSTDDCAKRSPNTLFIPAVAYNFFERNVFIDKSCVHAYENTTRPKFWSNGYIYRCLTLHG